MASRDSGPADSSPSPALTFELDSLVAERDIRTRGRRVFLTSLVIIFLGFAALGLILFSIAARSGSFSREAGPVLLTVFGAVIAGESWYVSRGYRPAPRRLTVDGRCALFEYDSRQVGFKLEWSDPRLRFTIYDLSHLPSVLRDGKPRITVFAVEPPRGPRTPVPPDAYEAIMREVAAHGLRIIHHQRPGRSSGRVVWSFVTGPR